MPAASSASDGGFSKTSRRRFRFIAAADAAVLNNRDILPESNISSLKGRPVVVLQLKVVLKPFQLYNVVYLTEFTKQ